MQERRQNGLGCRWSVVKAAVGADRFALPSAGLDYDLGLLQRKEQFPIQQLISELAVKALYVSVLPGTAGLNKERLHPNMTGARRKWRSRPVKGKKIQQV
jgi:hypothetical protein